METERSNKSILQVRFYESVDDSLVKFVVILSRYRGKWLYCRHRARSTWETPGGHREPGESILEAARRELYEETGAVRYTLSLVGIYGVTRLSADEKTQEISYGMLYCSDIMEMEKELHSEIEETALFEDIPDSLTYPQIQPLLLNEAVRRGFVNESTERKRK